MVTAGKRQGRKFRSSHLLHLCSGLSSPRLVPFMFSVSGGQWSAGPLPLAGSQQKVALPAPVLAAQGREAGRETARRQGTGPHGAPGLAPPALGTPPASPRGGRPHLCSMGSAFPGGVPRLEESRGSGRRLEPSCGFLSAHSPSPSPGPQGPIPPAVKGAHEGPARGCRARHPNDPPRGRSRRPDTQKLLETERASLS